MWRRILDRGLHAGIVVLCTPISGACIRICQICVFLPEVEMCYFYSETLISSRRHISKLMVPSPLSNCISMQLLRGDVYVRDGSSAYRQRGYECECCEVIVVMICSSGHNFYVFGIYRNPDLSDKIFYCLLAATTKVQSVDRKASFMFVGDVNAHHEE